MHVSTESARIVTNTVNTKYWHCSSARHCLTLTTLVKYCAVPSCCGITVMSHGSVQCGTHKCSHYSEEPCGLQHCNNTQAPFPGPKLYKATRPRFHSLVFAFGKPSCFVSVFVFQCIYYFVSVFGCQLQCNLNSMERLVSDMTKGKKQTFLCLSQSQNSSSYKC